jgi:hypothetical protein
MKRVSTRTEQYCSRPLVSRRTGRAGVIKSVGHSPTRAKAAEDSRGPRRCREARHASDSTSQLSPQMGVSRALRPGSARPSTDEAQCRIGLESLATPSLCIRPGPNPGRGGLFIDRRAYPTPSLLVFRRPGVQELSARSKSWNVSRHCARRRKTKRDKSFHNLDYKQVTPTGFAPPVQLLGAFHSCRGSCPD